METSCECAGRFGHIDMPGTGTSEADVTVPLWYQIRNPVINILEVKEDI